MKKMIITAAVTLAAFFAAADIMNINGDTADRHIGLNTNGVPVLYYIGQNPMLVGDDTYASSQADCATILVFRLPDLGGKSITSANLGTYIEIDYAAGAGSGHPGSTDTAVPKWISLYGLRYSSSSAVMTNDYGYKAVVGANDTLIQSQYYTATSNSLMDPVLIETDAAGDASLADWLTAQYANGAQAGDYVFLRVHSMQDTGNPFKVYSANDVSRIPVLSITAIPEPATIGMLGFGALVVIAARNAISK